MTEELASRAVFLDTSEFVQRKFDYTNKELASFRDLCQEGILRLVLTEVTMRELESNLKEQLDEAVAALKNLRKGVVVLRSLDEDWLRVLFQRPDKEKLLANLQEQLQDFLDETGYETVPTAELLAGSVLDRYFEGRPPFGSGEKKHEFPDAFALAALESWCSRTELDIYIVSGDGDVKKVCEEISSFVYADDLAGVLELALKDKGVQTDMAHIVFSKLRDDVEEASEIAGRGWIYCP